MAKKSRRQQANDQAAARGRRNAVVLLLLAAGVIVAVLVWQLIPRSVEPLLIQARQEINHALEETSELGRIELAEQAELHLADYVTRGGQQPESAQGLQHAAQLLQGR